MLIEFSYGADAMAMRNDNSFQFISFFILLIY